MSAYHIGVAGEPWGDKEKEQWRAAQSPKRSYLEDVVTKIDALRADYDVEQYGALSWDPEKYPLFCVRTRNFDASKPTVLVTGGVHGYETSGVHGALLFLATRGLEYSSDFNVVALPCVSPWGYETVQRWNPKAIDPNRSFYPDTPCEESAAALAVVNNAGIENWLMHIDLHETTDTDETEFRPAKEARDGVATPGFPAGGEVPDGFYLVGNSANTQLEWHDAIIKSVKAVTHIAPPDANGQIIETDVLQEGVVAYPTKDLFLCSSITNAEYATTTEVYPDSPSVTDESCNEAQVAAVTGALDFLRPNVIEDPLPVMQEPEMCCRMLGEVNGRTEFNTSVKLGWTADGKLDRC
eukprot:TRINITY_DN12363_c0_g1_i1.p1 TRINITY_DN12363_c0_g1~~TRINITY_DN12363_c0_g1_i1.p1  ORF type:complete len:353 (+),score=58.27 TRINITY_DN12363_c0_g1_i1:184-1242(+)